MVQDHPARHGFHPVSLAGTRSANRLTHRTLDPRSKIPEFKVSACRIAKADGPDPIRDDRGRHPNDGCTRRRLMFGYEFYIDPSRCIGCQSCVQACEECDTHRGISMINFDFIDRRESIATAAYVCLHCDDPTCAQVCPGGRDQERRGRHRPVLAEAALHRLLELRAGLPVRHPEDDGPERADDEVRHVLRPHVRGQAADVRHRLPQPGAGLRHARADRQHGARSRRTLSISAIRRSPPRFS